MTEQVQRGADLVTHVTPNTRRRPPPQRAERSVLWIKYQGLSFAVVSVE